MDKFGERELAELSALRAEFVAPENTPNDLITVNGCAELLDLDTGERMRLTLVFLAMPMRRRVKSPC